MRIRGAAVADRDAIVSMDHVAHSDPLRVAFIETSLRGAICLVAEDDAALLGYGILEYSFFGNAFIALVYVAEPVRRAGVGRSLMVSLESRCAGPKLFTSTNRSNLPMQRLLEQIGYEPSGIIYNLDVDDPELVFFKSVPGAA